MQDVGLKPPRSKTIHVAVCGNPNCGKTTIFNAITGLRQKVANYPGVTVEKTTGQFQLKDDPNIYTLIDIPGSYSLSAFSPDEYVAVQALLGELDKSAAPDLIVNIIDVTNIDRALYLLFQVMQIGKPVVVGLNMMDLADKRGLTIDIPRLEKELGGVPVIPLIGSRGKGIEELKAAIALQASVPHVPHRDFYHPLIGLTADKMIHQMQNGHVTRAEYLRVLFDINGPAEKAFIKEHGEKGKILLDDGRKSLIGEFGSLTIAETQSLTQRAAQVTEKSVHARRSTSRSRSEKIDKYLLHPVLGPIVLMLIMGFIFQSIFSWAEPIMNGIDSLFGALAGWVGSSMAEGPLQSLLVDGIIGGVGSVLIFLPQIIILFLFIAFLEDSGYMPRVAFLVDRAFSWCGLSGKSFIPLLSSFACAVPGIMATRVIEDRKLRIITILVAPLMTCSARLPVYAIMIAAFIPYTILLGFLNSHGVVLGMLYLLGLIVAVLVSLILKRTVLKTQRGTFMMEMPSYKVPTLQSILVRVFNRAKSFVLRAGTVILAITILIWALSYYPRAGDASTDYQSRIASIESTTSQQVAMIDAEISRLALSPEQQEASLFAGARFALVESPDELAAVRDELYLLRPDQLAAVELSHFRRTVELASLEQIATLENDRAGAHLRNSYLGRMGRTVEPLFAPLGWDWKITMATLASFPAREVIIATLGTIYNLGSGVDEGSSSLVQKMRDAKWEDGAKAGLPVFSPAVALSIMVFFALCCQCGATVVTIKQETGAWRYAIGVFIYMTVLAYLAAMLVYQLFSRIGW
ncbi:MAG: ferrous iron transport protein B [candidate division Zixibacteria bacterium]|nr:ferrous iron transport protein B [candidate division Zixibacteria bacterium]